MRAVLVTILCTTSGIASADDEATPVDVQDIAPEEPAPPPPASPAPATTATPQPVHTMDELTIPQSYVRFGINFFGDTSLQATRTTQTDAAFSIGTLDVRMLGELGTSLDALGEVAFEATDGGPIADVEQLAVRWRHARGHLLVGRFHTDLGYWNTAYHHGLWLQVPIDRPHALRFEDDGGLAPVHWVGAQLLLEGSVGGGRLGLVTAVGNGRGDIIDDVLTSADNNAAKSVLAKVRYKTPSVEVGASAVYDVIARATAALRPALPGERITELIGNAYLAVRAPLLSLFVETLAIRHLAGGEHWQTLAAYALAGYSVTSWCMPYAAVDVTHGADDDPFFNPDPAMATSFDTLELFAGTRFETSVWSALKVELQTRKRDTSTTREYAAVANWSFGL